MTQKKHVVLLVCILALSQIALTENTKPTVLKNDYIGRSADAAWRKAANERIEKHRKAELEIRVVDKDGKPVPGANVSVRQQRHAFGFGTQLSAKLLDDQTELGEQYRRHFLELFNYATVNQFYSFQWKNPRMSTESRRLAVNALKWLEQQDIPVHGHVLVWWYKDENIKKNKQEVHDLVVQHIDETIGFPDIGSRVQHWDVQNEPFQNSDIFNKLGRDSIAEWFRRSHAHEPSATLFLNEAGLCSRMDDKRWQERVEFTYHLAKEIKDSGAPIHGLGLQSHHTGSLAPIPEVVKTLDRFAKLGLELQVTEYDIRLLPSTNNPKAGYEKNWRTPGPPIPPEMEQLEADYLRDYLTACFSQPAMTAFIMWGFTDNHHWLYNAPLLRKDWTPKPAGLVWKDLVYRQWWTKADGTTSDNGTYRTRGFLGDYEITVEHDGRQQVLKPTLSKDGKTVTAIW
ncbi:MAG: endo-1,4-beta-xylanase [Kiritimatiellales bacterium]|nr:endo-1,4-beta-xylanase [Kiritimatiellales bacterium]